MTSSLCAPLTSDKHSQHDIAGTLRLPSIEQKFPNEFFILMQPDLISRLLSNTAPAEVVTNPKRWLKICRLAQQSVVQVLPQRYGHSGCLDDAIDLVSRRVRLCFVLDEDRNLAQRQVERAYLRSLRSLQVALGSKDSVSWDVWYATLLLCLFEVWKSCTFVLLLLNHRSCSNTMICATISAMHEAGSMFYTHLGLQISLQRQRRICSSRKPRLW